jgi:hypothetical protein
MPQICKKHGKPRTVIYERKMPKGGVFSLVGCADCAAAARERLKPPPPRKPPTPVNLRRL